MQYDWSESYQISAVEVYWFDDNGGVLTPTTAYLEYWDGGAWINVGDVPKAKDSWNTLTLNGEVIDQLRLSMLNSSQSTGILEWRVLGVPVANSVTNIAPLASATTSFVSSWETLDALNDESNPANSNDKSSGAYGNWDNPNSIQWVQYDWSASYQINAVEVYWFDDNGGVLTPTSAYVEYWDGSTWINAGEVPKVKDAWNTLALNGKLTDRLRLSMLNSTQSTGILEWRVLANGQSSRVSDRNYAFETSSHSGIEMAIYPNPASEKLMFDLMGSDDQIDVSILDSTGRILKRMTLDGNGSNEIRTDDFANHNGLFFIQTKSGAVISNYKIMINR